jgi:hypothetical protein
MHHINDPYLPIGFHLDIYHSHQGHHPSLSIGFHLDIYHSLQGHHINQLLDINQLHPLTSIQTITSMTYDPTISQIIKPLASMTT